VENVSSFFRWAVDVPETGWTVGYDQLTLSHLSTEYVLVPVAATKAGVPYNPTSDTLQFAFMPTPTQVPQVSDWVTGIWESVSTNIIYPYNAKCLVGPSGTITLIQGTYVIYIKITDNPEIPVLVGGQLVIM
jgi:hypothetical protein